MDGEALESFMEEGALAESHSLSEGSNIRFWWDPASPLSLYFCFITNIMFKTQ